MPQIFQRKDAEIQHGRAATKVRIGAVIQFASPVPPHPALSLREREPRSATKQDLRAIRRLARIALQRRKGEWINCTTSIAASRSVKTQPLRLCPSASLRSTCCVSA